jgi:hypothetical protein
MMTFNEETVCYLLLLGSRKDSRSFPLGNLAQEGKAVCR